MFHTSKKESDTNYSETSIKRAIKGKICGRVDSKIKQGTDLNTVSELRKIEVIKDVHQRTVNEMPQS
jgi:hypothetical protein